jgi:hypothetical protein
MKEIKGIQQLDALTTNTYLLSVIIALGCIFIAIGISTLISWQGGNSDGSYIKRRIWFIIIGCILLISFFCYNNFHVMDRISNVAFQAKFMNCIALSSGLCIVVYFIPSLIIMKVFPKSKFGSIISKK